MIVDKDLYRRLIQTFIIFFISLTILSCNDKKENIKKLFNVEDNIDLAIKSQDIKFIESVIYDIEIMEEVFPEHQSLKEKKYTLEIRLRRYEDAINTIDSLLLLVPNDIDNRIIQGILLEITGNIHRSITVFEEALLQIDIKITNMLKKDEKKKLGRDINRVMILKLLRRDTQMDYQIIKNDPTITNHPEILELLYLLEDGSREQILNRYR